MSQTLRRVGGGLVWAAGGVLIAAAILWGIYAAYGYIYSPLRSPWGLLNDINSTQQAPDETEREYLAKQGERIFTFKLRPTRLLVQSYDFWGQSTNKWADNDDGVLNMATYDVEAGMLRVDVKGQAIRIGSGDSLDPYYVYLKDFNGEFAFKANLAIQPVDFRAMVADARWRITFRADNIRRHPKDVYYRGRSRVDAPVVFRSVELVVDDLVLLSLTPERVAADPAKAKP